MIRAYIRLSNGSIIFAQEAINVAITYFLTATYYQHNERLSSNYCILQIKVSTKNSEVEYMSAATTLESSTIIPLLQKVAQNHLIARQVYQYSSIIT
ncbi:SsrA-binding protein [Dirofilaria immitis]